MDIEQLIKLSKIFKDGFTVECKGHNLKQYTNYDKPFIVNYKTIIEIEMDNIKDTVTYKNMDKLPVDCIIGGWFDKSTATYFIEINKAFETGIEAMKFAWHNNQKAIYNIATGDVIEV